jgi:predicted ATPase
LSLVLIAQATAEEVHRVYYKPRHKPRLRWSDALLQGPAVGWGRRLNLGSLNLTSRFLHLLLLLLRPVVVKKGS